ncbi:MAG TPA: tRNA preQ1(34) S-adenosylmethionine ribosyltransferase-isomerase QueA [bacterium]|nr:tRNA preQ1(34) S-adenosylmethionine ribosyltransferase-isomerase QueA [bacterium]
MNIFDLNIYDYILPGNLIAGQLAWPRDRSRLMMVNLQNRAVTTDRLFANIVDYLNDDYVIVRNNTKVFPARLWLIKEGTGAMTEMLFLREREDNGWEVMSKRAKKIRVGDAYNFRHKGRMYNWKVVGVGTEGIRILDVGMDRENFLRLLDEVGSMPLPPYVEKVDGVDYKTDYQTIFAKNIGSVAAPTAGFHFTNDIEERLKDKGVIVEEVTLHVGAGTFAPVRTDDIRQHQMHEEFLEVDKEVIDRLNKWKKSGKKILAVGTTTTRFLESLAGEDGRLRSEDDRRSTDLFVYPGYKFRFVDEMITNFHLPKSTLLMLVSGFVFDKGDFEKEMEAVEFLKSVYMQAIKEKFRFYSFGDAMWIRTR